MAMTDQNERDERIRERVKSRMSLALAATLAASVAAPFAIEAVGWEFRDVVVVLTTAFVLVSGWRVIRATGSTDSVEVDGIWLDHTVLWVYSILGLGVAGIVWLYAGSTSDVGQSWILLAYSVPMAAVSWALRRRCDELRD